MNDDEGYEQFELNQTDLEFALNPGRRHFQTREQATYGIWADEDSDDDNRRPSLGQRKGNYSAPVNFVSGGVKIGEKIINEKDGSEQSTSKTVTIDSSFTYKPLQPKQKKQAGANVIAGMRTSTTSRAPDPNTFCDWTKGGKGSVIKDMMQKMGYKWGEGLGKDGTGIVEPVQAQVRQGRGAVGAYGKESTGPKFGESAADAQKRIAAESAAGYAGGEEKETIPKRSWKRNDKTKTRYKTIDEITDDAGTIPSKMAKNNIKVIDMTGPEQRVYRGYDSFALKTRVDTEEENLQNFDVKEIRHNLNLLLDMTEQNIRRSNGQLRSLKDQSTALEYDLNHLKTVLVDEEKEAQRMKRVYELLEQFSSRKTNLSMSEIQGLFLKLRSDFPHEYRLFNLESVAIPMVLPLIRDYFSQWKPLEKGQDGFGIELMDEWKEILRDDDKSLLSANIHSLDQISAYDRLLWEGWIPFLRRSALTWDPRDQMEEMLRIVEQWLPNLPDWMKENVLEQIIIPRIVERVALWDPLTDVIPIHAWIIPWMEHLGDRLQPVLSQIRQKLAKILRDKWNPSDVSALAMLKPWVNVWNSSTMSAFLGQHIIPKLERFLEAMPMTPMDFRPDNWKALVSWMEMISHEIMANILTKYLFPRWYNVLCTWLNSPGVNLQEVRDWFVAWKSRIPDSILAFPTIEGNMKRALISMNEAAHGMTISEATMLPSQPIPVPIVAPPPVRMPQQQLSLRDVVEMSAARYGLTYVPQKDRMKDGRQVFWFGSVSIYMDRGVVFCMDPQEFVWRPVSMDELLTLAGAHV